MKHFISVFFIALLCQNLTEAQTPTYAGLPGPENVLVVYKQPTSLQDSLGLISDSIKEYYRIARNIPSENIIFPGLRFPDTTFSIDGITHTLGLAQVSDIIRDFDQDSSQAVNPTFHAWQYFITYVRNPIYNYIHNHNLTNTIRYIVLCKGVPCKIQARGNDSGIESPYGSIALDGILCLMNTENYETFIHDEIYANGKISNPYHNVDSLLTMDYRFQPDHFTETLNGYDVKLSYLVSHLDGINLQNVYNIIDGSVDADSSETGWWILDDDNTQTLEPAKSILTDLGVNVYWDDSFQWLTDNLIHNDETVMGYVSWGANSHIAMDSTYWMTLLVLIMQREPLQQHLKVLMGQVLQLWFGELQHGLITQFTENNLHNSGGSGFSANAWEPYLPIVTAPEYLFSLICSRL